MRVMLVDDTRLFRDGIANLLRAQGHDVVAEAGSGGEAVAKAAEVRPDLVLMDIRMAGMNGVEATRTIKAQQPQIKIVMLTVSEDEEDLLEAVKSGADGYLLKNITSNELFEELQTMERGGAVITRSLAGKLLEEFRRKGRREDTTRQTALSPRELELLGLVAAGASNREAAARLFISENTVKYHMKRILEKLQLENRAQVVAWAARHVKSS